MSGTKKGEIVHLIDDDRSFLTAVARLLRAEDYEVALFSSARECLASLSPHQRGCVVVDLRMPECDGLEFQLRLVEAPNPLPIVFLTAEGDIPSSVRAIQRGAVDFLTKLAPGDDLLDAVERALARDREESARRGRLRELQSLFATLTARERDVFRHVVQGKLNKQIAADLGTVERTVKLHRTSLTRKLKAPSVAELVQIWTFLHGRNEELFPKGQ